MLLNLSLILPIAYSTMILSADLELFEIAK